MTKNSFPSTHWSLILDGKKRKECLEELANKYWQAIFAYAQRLTFSEEKAEELVQELFLELQKGNLLDKADPNKGKFRAYLMGVLKNFHKRQLYKDKKNVNVIEQVEVADYSKAEDVFHQEWAQLLVNQALAELKEYCSSKGDREVALKAFELHCFDNKKAGEVAKILDLEVKWVSEKIYRLKQKYGEFLRKIVAQTLAEGESVEEEIHLLMEYL